MTARRRLTAWVAVLLATVVGATSCLEPPSSLQVDVVVSGLARPWDLAFTPDGTLLWTERNDRSVNALVDDEVRELHVADDVVVSWEAGMLGLAVDPDFATNRRIYTCLVSNRPGLAGPDVRVVRWVVSSDYTSLSDRTDILTGIPVEENAILIAHVGCRPRFGPDGYLWVTTGDARTPTAPQDPQSLAGKVLRIDTEGAPAADNPGPPLAPEVYTFGHRNPQGIAFHPTVGWAFSVEHGPDRDDEINLLRAGANYGWDPVDPTTGEYSSENPMTDLTKFPDAVEAVWSSGSPTIAPSGATILLGEQWAGWSHALAVAVLKGQQLFVLRFGDGGTVVVREYVDITDQGRLRSAVQGPDGNLYLAQDAEPGNILRVVPTP